MSAASLAVLGATGSIGTQTLQVVADNPGWFTVTAITGGSNAELAIALAKEHDVGCVAMGDVAAAATVRDALGPRVDVLEGAAGVAAVAGSGADIVVNGLVGSRGLVPTLEALGAGSRLALANKESLIAGGDLVLAAAAPGQLVPVDSEHSALAQCLRGGSRAEVARLVVTASGGPFRGWTTAELAGVRPSDALAHPTWSMGAVITINSATLANKGLEVIEAHLLFGIPYDRIVVVVHPQSIVHGMVEFHDGATIAKLSPPDMRLPIQIALGWPDRIASAPARMDWTHATALEFEPVDDETFPLLSLSVSAGRAGGTAPGVLNAANEEAVSAFLAERIGFLSIPRVVEAVLEEHTPTALTDVEAVLEAERWARRRARATISKLT